MGLFKKIKKALKKAWNAVKATVRAVVRIVIEVIARVINLITYLVPVKRKMRFQAIVLRDENGPLLDDAGLKMLQNQMHETIKIFSDKFDIELTPYEKPGITILSSGAPVSALDVKCGKGAASNEWGEAGAYFANHLAGWNAIPVSLKFPISVYIVRTIGDKWGCSLGPLTDYVTLSKDGATKSLTTIAHEMGHACGLRHRDNSNNLMYADPSRGTNVTKWQKFSVRTSRHCTIG